jgi:acetoacetate decarboxylase
MWDQDDIIPQKYASVETLLLQFETDPDAIPPLLPEPFKPGKLPLVTVMFADNNGVDFMAGGGYRFAAISVAAQFEGHDGHFEGSYVLCMPEDKTLPIITGREWLGMPKFFADISSIRKPDKDRLRCDVSLWGHLLFGIEVALPLKSQNALVRKAASSQATRTPSFGYKYIASLNGPPDADYPTIMWSDNKLSELQLGQTGELFFGDPSEKDIGAFKPVVEALKTLPVRRVKQTAYSQGSMVLRNDKNGEIQ